VICEQDNTITCQKMRVAELFSILFHMKLFIGAKALIVHEGKVLLVREAAYDEGTNEGKWDVPGGRINPEEPILEGLQREVTEESGLLIEPGEVLGVFETFPTIKGEACHIVRVYYEATPQTLEVALSQDHAEFAWVTVSDLEGKECVNDVSELVKSVLHN